MCKYVADAYTCAVASEQDHPVHVHVTFTIGYSPNHSMQARLVLVNNCPLCYPSHHQYLPITSELSSSIHFAPHLQGKSLHTP